MSKILRNTGDPLVNISTHYVYAPPPPPPLPRPILVPSAERVFAADKYHLFRSPAKPIRRPPVHCREPEVSFMTLTPPELGP